MARNRPAEAERHIPFAVRVRCPQLRRHQIRGPTPCEPLPACAEAASPSSRQRLTVTLLTLCISMGPLCDGEPYRFPPTTNVPVSSRLLSKLLKQPRTKDLHVPIKRPSEHRSNHKLRKWAGRRCPLDWTDVRCRFLSRPRILSTPISLNCALMRSDRLGLNRGGRRLPPSQEERLQQK